VEATRLGDRARGKLIHLLSDDHPEPGPWVGRLKSLSDLENAPVFSNAVRFLFHLTLDDPEAEALLERVLVHRTALAGALGRDPGVRVAAMDYLSNVDRRYENPQIVEMQEFEETERSARTDTLTGLWNRKVFHEQLEGEIRRSRRYRWPVTVLMLDLDHFKQINDTHGHGLGDLVLARVGGIVRHAVREPDAACRIGGEEFAVVLPETAREGGYAVAERMRKRVQQSFAEHPVDGHDVPVTISAGLACFPDDGLHADELLARADEALYGAKHAGRNRVCVHYREKRAAIRFPAKAGTSVHLDGAAGTAINLSRTGVLIEIGGDLSAAAPVFFRIERGASHPDPATVASGRVARILPRPARVPHVRAAVAFDVPLAEDELMTHVSLSRTSARVGRGVPR
jgi:diguanylate cyclase (GGDEF)-like protein